MKKINAFQKFLTVSAVLILGYISINAQIITSHQIDSLVGITMKTFDVPGIAVAIVKDDKGYSFQRIWCPLTKY